MDQDNVSEDLRAQVPWRKRSALADLAGFDRAREIPHDRSLVNIELGGQHLVAVGRNDWFGSLPLLFFPVGKIRGFTVAGRICLGAEDRRG